MRRLGLVLGVLVLIGLPASQAQATPLTIGFNSGLQFEGGAAASRDLWVQRAVGEGAGTIRYNIVWYTVAPYQRPAGFAPADPASPGYNWTTSDAMIRELSSHGLQVLVNVAFAPPWAEAAGRSGHAPPGTWRPDPSQFASFARAAALRYSGHFPDPLHPGSFLPRVRYWQAWNEPNVPNDLNPQWIRSHGRWMAESPILYRGLLNAFYAAVKSVSASNFVVTAGTAPYGDLPGVSRIPPVTFDRDLFCLRNNSRLSPLRCPDPPQFDALSHHPYGVSNPLWHAFNPGDAAPADTYKIARVLRAARHWHHVLPAGPKRLWVTETSWDSNPPDPNGIPVEQQARFVEQTMYVLWRQGVDTILWFELVDSPPVPDYASTVQGGMYYVNGQPKPAAQALRFPFVTRRLDRRHIEAWGRAPKGGRLIIEKRRGRGWTTLRTRLVTSHQLFWATLPISGRADLRARMAGETSLDWNQAG